MSEESLWSRLFQSWGGMEEPVAKVNAAHPLFSPLAGVADSSCLLSKEAQYLSREQG